MTGDVRAGPGRRRMARPRSSRLSIRTRVLAIVLIPSAALLITGVSVTASLISDGLSARDFADNFVQGNGPIVQTTAALYQERTLSLQAVGGDRQARAGLRAQWNATNAAISQLVKVANAAQALNAQAVSGSTNVLPKLIEELPVMRHNVQAGRVAAAEVDDYYTQFANNGSSAFLQSAIAMPSTTAAVNEVTVLDMNMALNQHSRVVGLGSGWATHGVVPQSDRQQLAQLTGAYQNQLQSVIPRLPASGQAAYGALTAGSAWRLATSGESDLALHGTLAVPLGTWLTAENTVSTDLLVVWGTEMHDTEASAVDAANQTVNRSILVGSLVLALSIAAFVAALLLANGLVRRLRRLRATTLELADVNLPSMIRRIGDGEPVDPESETALRGYGSDEIGQVAEAFNSAQLTAVRAAVAEARTRGGISKVFLDIAHRSQLVVHRQLELLDVAEAKQSDPEHLELLFQLDHLATRARRNAENLLILGGGQPGRRWRRPAALEDIVRSAVSETEHFARVRTVRLPDVQVQGAVVGDLIHLLAELVDNATAFSPPDAQ